MKKFARVFALVAVVAVPSAAFADPTCTQGQDYYITAGTFIGTLTGTNPYRMQVCDCHGVNTQGENVLVNCTDVPQG